MDIQCDGGEGVPSQRRDRSIRSQIPPSPLTSPTRNRLVSYPPGQEGQPIAQAGAVMIARRGERPGGQRLRLESIAKKPQTGQDFPGLAGEISNKRLRARRGKKNKDRTAAAGRVGRRVGRLAGCALASASFEQHVSDSRGVLFQLGEELWKSRWSRASPTSRQQCQTSLCHCTSNSVFFLSFFGTSRRLTFPIQPAEHPVPEPKTGIDCRKNALTRPDSQARPVADIIQHNR